MKRVLYLMQINWDWIFQRPHIFAKLLEDDFQCDVVYPKSIIRREAVVKNKIQPKCGKPAYSIPLQTYIPLIKKLNDYIVRKTIGSFEKYDFIWVCHPSLSIYIPEGYKGKIIYDCMDNHAAMISDSRRGQLLERERELCERADLILASSEKLKSIINRADKTIVVRNGFKKSYVFPISTPKRKNVYEIGYFGTVAEWFDFNTLEKSLDKRADIVYKIIGPCACQIPSNDRIIFEGTVEHDKLYAYVENYDALIMPFVVNELILSVDPVKLYEYIGFGKCIISIYYPELERFRPFVYFYENAEEYEELITTLVEKGFPPKYTEEERNEFLNENSWEYRYQQVKEVLKTIIE